MTERTNDTSDRRKNVADRRFPDVEHRVTETMSSAEKSAKVAYLSARLVLVGMLLQLLVIGYVFITEQNGREEAVKAARLGCERDKLDRQANARGWREAAQFRRIQGDTQKAEEYQRIADDMTERSQIDCTASYPDASFFP